MKICICCGTKADAIAPTCANCGEGSWTVSIVPSEPEEKATEAEGSSVGVSPDLDTSPEIPARRRRNR